MSSQYSGQVAGPEKKPGHFWELEAWMRAHDVDDRELAILSGVPKSILCRYRCGQFVMVKPGIQRKLKDATQGAIADGEWQSFFSRRLDDRSGAAA